MGVLCPFADVEKNSYIGDMKTRSIFDGVFSYLNRNCLGFVVGINFRKGVLLMLLNFNTNNPFEKTSTYRLNTFIKINTPDHKTIK